MFHHHLDTNVKVYVYVIGWQAVVFGINSSRIVNRKEIVLDEKPAVLLQINPISLATVAKQQ